MAPAYQSPAIAHAERASISLNASLAQKSDDMPIETDVRSLRGLAVVIDALLQEARQCAGPDCMGRIVDGMKLWVTQDRLESEAAKSAEMDQIVKRYESALRAIADARPADPTGLDMLADWHGIALSFGDVARRALEEQPGRN